MLGAEQPLIHSTDILSGYCVLRKTEFLFSRSLSIQSSTGHAWDIHINRCLDYKRECNMRSEGNKYSDDLEKDKVPARPEKIPLE